MANNKIIVSSGNGTYQETTSSFSIDNDNGIISASSAVVATSSLPTNVSGVLQVYKGKVIPLWVTSSIWQNYDNDNNQLTTFDGAFGANLSGTLFQYRNDIPLAIDGKDYNGIGPHRVASASFNGDIIGTVSASVPVKIISVANVTGGILDSRFGGTGTGSFENGAIVTLSGSGFKPSDSANNVIATDINGNWSMANKTSIEPNFTPLTGTLVYLFTGSAAGGITYSTNWTVPNGTRFIRVICQGAGGGGASGNNYSSGQYFGGGGGGGGGYSEVLFNANYLKDQTILITAGTAGSGAISMLSNGTSGGSSSFGAYLYGNGGSAGEANTGGGSATLAATFAGGIGYIDSGSSGIRNNTTSLLAANTIIAGPGGGTGASTQTNYQGGAGGGINKYSIPNTAANPTYTPGATWGGTASELRAILDGRSYSYYSFLFKKYFLNGQLKQDDNFPKLLSTGGSGGSMVNLVYNSVRAGSGGSPDFGGGGGGGGAAATPGPSNYGGYGGNGGKGYVLIICT